MRFIELIIAATAIIVAVNASPIVEKREVINAEVPFDSKAFVFNPREMRNTKVKKGRLHKRTFAKGCCGNFGLDLNTNLKFGANAIEGADPAASAVSPPPPVAVPAPVTPPAPPAPPTSNDHDTIIVNVDNKINH